MIVYSNCSSLIIRGNDALDFDEINNNIPLVPTTIVRKGEIKSKVIDKAKKDVWIYTVEEENNEETNVLLEKLLCNIKPYLNYIKKLSETTDICIKYFVHSDLAQIGWDFSPELIKELAYFNINLEVFVISWGGVEMDDDDGENDGVN